MSRAELLRQVCEKPADDRARLAYASALEAAGDPRGEFIRLQVASAAGEPFTAREGHLLAKHRDEWLEPVRHMLAPKGRNAKGFRFIRGFPAFVQMSPAGFLQYGRELFMQVPVQHADVYFGAKADVRRCLDRHELAQLISVSFEADGIDDDLCATLARCPRLARARWLVLAQNKIGERGAAALAASPIMDNKVVIDLSYNPCDPVEAPAMDFDGSVQGVEQSHFGQDLVKRYGRKRWLTFPWRSRRDRPTRFEV